MNNIASRSYLPIPITHPACSMREAVKHMIMLEDHLLHPSKRCPDCIHKHFLAIEAFLEESVSLDTDGVSGIAQSLIPFIPACFVEYKRGTDCLKIACFIRKVRKKVADTVFLMYPKS